MVKKVKSTKAEAGVVEPKPEKKIVEKSKTIKKEKKDGHKKSLENGVKSILTNKAEKKAIQKKEVVKEKTQESIEKKKAKKLAQKEKKLALEKDGANKTSSPTKVKGPLAKAKVNGSSPTKGAKAEGKKKIKAQAPEAKANGVSLKKAPKADAKKKVKAEKAEVSGDKRAKNLETDAATIFIGNLPNTTKRNQLIQLFKKYGPVTSIRFRTASGKIIFKSKQRKEADALNAYMLLKDAETAQKAVEMNGTEFKDRHIRVTLASSKTVKADNEVDAKRTVIVGNLKYSANEESLREIFTSCGEIESIRCIRSEKGCTGIAFILFKSPEAVGLALELKGTLLDDRPINVERYSVNKKGTTEARMKTENANTKTGAARRVANGKQKKMDKTGSPKKPAANNYNKNVKKEKYSGVKVNAINKKKDQKKKIPGQMKALAKKIAPLKG